MKKGGLWLVIALVAIAALATLSFNYLKDNLQLGLDLKGGAEVVLQAVPDEGEEITYDDMVALQEIMRNRVDSIGVSEPVIQLQGDDRIIIELAGVDDPDEAIELVGKTAKLEFVDPLGNVILTGSDLVDATGVKTTDSSGMSANAISIEFSTEAAAIFAAATAKYMGQPIYIYIDDELIMAPTVNSVITDGKAQITGDYTFEEAISQAAILKGGALPVNVEVMSKRTVGPTLGADSLEKSLNAGMIGLSLLVAFMVLYYRLPGVVATLSLIVYTSLLMLSLTALGITLTLPSIAGLVLSIGMAVDANIIIYERLREELAVGKTLKAGVYAAFQRALWTILDSNITTLIAAVVLFQFGTGSVQGFAVTLGVGIVISMFSALVVTRFLLNCCTEVKAFQNPKLFASLKGGASNE